MKLLWLIVIIVSTLSLTGCTTRIPAGYEGIIINSYGNDKGVSTSTLITGRVWYNPFSQDVVTYPTFVQTKDYSPFQVSAKDGSMFTVDPTIGYRITPWSTPKIYEKYRKDISSLTDTVMLNYVKDAFRTVLNSYTTDEILYKRNEIELKIAETLSGSATPDGIVFEQITSWLQYPQTIVDAITEKNKAVQEAQRIENEVKITEANAKKKAIESEATANALLIQAKAEAEANRLRQQSLTPLLVQQQFIEKWDGKLPTYGEVPQLFKDISK